MNRVSRRRKLLLGAVVATSIAATFVPMAITRTESGYEHEHEGEEDELVDGVPGGIAWFYDQRAFPAGIPSGAYLRSVKQSNRLPSARTSGRPLTAAPLVTGAGPAWQAIGPRPLSGPVTPSVFQLYSGPAPWAGRVTAIATDPGNSNTAYVGGALGGVWKTTDGGSTWAPLFDDQTSLAIGSIAVAKTDAQEVFVGTGEANGAAFDTADSYYGTGLYLSTNGGQDWSHIADARFDGCHIAAIQISPTNAAVIDLAVVKATGRSGPGTSGTCVPGIYRSINTGSTWSLALDTVVSGKEFPVLSFAVAPGAPTVWYAGLEFAGVYRSLDSGATWARMTTGLPAVASVGRVAVSASGATGQVYAAIGTPDKTEVLQGVYASSDSGSTWSGVTSTNFCSGDGGNGGQCKYDLAIAADPSTSSVFYTGGVILRRFTSFGASSGAILNPSDTNGSSGVHWDVHALTFDAAGRLWIGTDGGVWRTSDGGSTVSNLNGGGLTLEQFYPGISGSANGPLLGGMQDNASGLFTGSPTWRQKAYGDGGGSGVDPTTSPPTLYTTSYGFSILRSSDGGTTWAEDQNSGINTSQPQEFIWPFSMGGGTPRRLYAGTNEVYRSTNRAVSWQGLSPAFPNAHGDGRITAIAEAPSGNGSVLYAGTHDGQIQVTTDTGAHWTDTNGNSSPVPWRYITDFAINPANALDAYVSVSGFDGSGIANSGHVFHTTNGGGTWTDANGTGGAAPLPNTPVSALALDNVNNPHRLFAGTDVGVFVSVDGGLNWSAYGSGLPGTAVVDLLADTSAGKLVAATHGRGMYAAMIAPAPANDAFANATTISGAGGSITGTTAGATKQGGEPQHGGADANAGGASVWYSWTPAASGSVTIDTIGSGQFVDTLLGVYTGSSVDGLTLVAGDDDISGQVGGPSSVTFDAVGGTTYRVAVDGYNGGLLPSTGPIKLRWNEAGVDAIPPSIQLDAHPPAVTSSAAADFAFSGSDADSPPVTFTCSLDGAEGACTSPKSYTGLADGPHTFAVTAHDSAGNASNASTFNWTVDTVSPSADLTAPTKPVSLASSVTIAWSGSDGAGSGIANYEVRYRRAHYDGGFGSWVYPASWQDLTGTSVSQTPLTRGYDYCWDVRAVDLAGNLSPWSADRCRAVPLDDRSLSASSAWTRATGTAYWNGTVTRTTSRGAVLSLAGARLDRVGLVATMCPTCGSVGIFVGGVRVGVVDLFATTTVNRKLILLDPFAYRTGTVTVKTTTSGESVRIDGLVVSRT